MIKPRKTAEKTFRETLSLLSPTMTNEYLKGKLFIPITQEGTAFKFGEDLPFRSFRAHDCVR